MSLFYKKKGQLCEDKALEYFLTQNYQLIERNYKVFDVEIDLILKKKSMCYFVEVKSNNKWRMSHSILPYAQQVRLSQSIELFAEFYDMHVELLLAVVEVDTVRIYSLDLAEVTLD